ncbi:hypothetical protein ASF56_09765 [Methylobacterium sp. Leaf122]|nr:hypothetical protein [Methylobacterium sp. Leaf122]KQQ04704.1 hypothetical protein ASF56_09765 [Methylobacterium sp. Leaf122]
MIPASGFPLESTFLPIPQAETVLIQANPLSGGTILRTGGLGFLALALGGYSGGEGHALFDRAGLFRTGTAPITGGGRILSDTLSAHPCGETHLLPIGAHLLTGGSGSILGGLALLCDDPSLTRHPVSDGLGVVPLDLFEARLAETMQEGFVPGGLALALCFELAFETVERSAAGRLASLSALPWLVEPFGVGFDPGV